MKLGIKKFAIHTFLLSAIILGIVFESNAQEESFTTYNKEEQDREILTYKRSLIISRHRLFAVNEYMANAPSIQEIKKLKKKLPLTNDQRAELRTSYVQFLDSVRELDLIIQGLEKNIDPLKSSEYFYLSWSAFLAQYRGVIEFLEHVKKIPSNDIFFNEVNTEYQIEADSFKKIKFHFLNVEKFLKYSGLKLESLNLDLKDEVLKKMIDEDNKVIEKFHLYRGTIATIKNTGKIIQSRAFKTYFPIQKNISEWMGDERVARGDQFLINEAQIAEVNAIVKPGDVMIERREWYLSNIGLPGFWPHAALYLGRPEERKELNENVVVQEWVRSEGVESGSFEELLSSRYPEVYAESLKEDDHHKPYRVLEAMSEGVVFTSMEHSANADSLAVLRPKLELLDIAKSIVTALKYKGRPYDFNFDFRTDSEVVCSELIFYTYQTTDLKNGLSFPVTTTLGRPVVTPNNIVKEFSETYGTEKQQYDFVLFLDGNDKKRQAKWSSVEELNKSWSRPKWFIFTQK